MPSVMLHLVHLLVQNPRFSEYQPSYERPKVWTHTLKTVNQTSTSLTRNWKSDRKINTHFVGTKWKIGLRRRTIFPSVIQEKMGWSIQPNFTSWREGCTTNACSKWIDSLQITHLHDLNALFTSSSPDPGSIDGWKICWVNVTACKQICTINY